MLEVTAKNETGFFYDKLILEDGVEFIGIINKNGRIEHALGKEDLDLTTQKKEMYLMGLALQSSMQSDYDNEFGPASYTMTERKNSKFVSIPSFPNIILVIMKKSIDHTVVINKIKIAIKNFVNVIT